jgi:adenylate cyclase
VDDDPQIKALLAQIEQERDRAVEQLAAMAEVLEIISQTPESLSTVFSTLLLKALQLCHAEIGILFTYDGDRYTATAMQGTSPEFSSWLNKGPIKAGERSGLGRIAVSHEIVHVKDIVTEDIYRSGDPLRLATADLGGARTFLAVPMMKADHLVGAFTIYRQDVRPFDQAHIDLVKSFSSQAVIAIENVRLMNELRVRTEELQRSYKIVQQQKDQLESKSHQLVELNTHLEGRVAEQVAEIDRMSKLRRFLPPQIADLILSSGADNLLESHRREITAVFCDLRGFTGFSESAEPEDVMNILREYHEEIGRLIFKHDGTLERFVGDGLMVIFNDPVKSPNPPLQAVRMAIEIRQAVEILIKKWKRLGHDLGFGVGISHGYATLGTIGFQGRFDYAAIGTVANLASRLSDEAKAGQILIAPRVAITVENDVEIELLGELTLKGIRRPLAVYNVITESLN